MSNVMRWRYGDTNPVKIPVDAATVTGGDALLAQQVIGAAATSPELAIGRCARRTSSGTKILVSIRSTVMNDGPQAVA